MTKRSPLLNNGRDVQVLAHKSLIQVKVTLSMGNLKYNFKLGKTLKNYEKCCNEIGINFFISSSGENISVSLFPILIM